MSTLVLVSRSRFQAVGLCADVAGRVCVPINPALIDQFDPETVPTVGELLRDLDNVPTNQDDKTRIEGESRWCRPLHQMLIADYEHTALKPYVKMFEDHVKGIMKDVERSRKGEFRYRTWGRC